MRSGTSDMPRTEKTCYWSLTKPAKHASNLEISHSLQKASDQAGGKEAGACRIRYDRQNDDGARRIRGGSSETSSALAGLADISSAGRHPAVDSCSWLSHG